MVEDNNLIISGVGDIKFIEPEQLHAIEIYFAGGWAPVTFGDGIRLTAPNKTAGEHLIEQLKRMHEVKGKKMPPHRIRLMTKIETKDVKRHLERHNLDGKFGTDIKKVKPLTGDKLIPKKPKLKSGEEKPDTTIYNN